MGNAKIGQQKSLAGSQAIRTPFSRNIMMTAASSESQAEGGIWDAEKVASLEAASKHSRLIHLEEQAMDAIR